MDHKMRYAMEALRAVEETVQLSPDLRERILLSVKQESQSRSPMRQAGRTKWLLVATLVFIFASGFASITWYKIQNQQGETVMEYQAAPPLSKERLAELQAAQAKLDEVRSKLAPGTAAAVYQKNEAGQGEVSYIAKPYMLNELVELNTHLKNILDYPAEIATAYKFKEGMVSYDYQKDEALEENLKRKADETNQALMVEPVTVLPTVYHASAAYEDAAGNQLRVNMLKQFWVGNSMMTVPGANQIVEEVSIGGSEGLYIEREDPYGKMRREVRWMDQDWSLSINSTDSSMTKEKLLEIANDILERRS
ncbi:hypothetical protein T458_21905 [Brevibacillus panacihumi W25]|uniref:DUF4367 domain-containing protein n=2 Tax=Brevibacillus panacihumi TaxID=497735 RepID=V6M5U8_9BACL|nr:hypothetical protein [Brevibacillus panacihumi]EST53944.1 hypothetical protein T458_21905 [Brevibacillus panacihumi W25]RNB77640.1 hypothetical protein EDM58_14265 [Brevibacillus panacihumi]